MDSTTKLIIGIVIALIGLIGHFPPLDFLMCFVGGCIIGSAIIDKKNES